MITNNDKLSVAEIYSENNAYRLKPYHRMDLAINFDKTTYWGEKTWSFNIYTAINQNRNPLQALQNI